MIKNEMQSLYLGPLLGSGMSRNVYIHKRSNIEVIKKEEYAGHFQNIIEWETWKRVKGTRFEKFFAPCIDISQCGIYLIQARTTPIRLEDAPRKMPKFLCDFKIQNYGMRDGHICCHDYGTNLLFEYGLTKKEHVANWYDSQSEHEGEV